MGFVADVGVPVYDVTSGSWSRSKPTAVFKYASFLEGGADADVLVGTKGADRLSGGFEMDEITGGLGDDLLIGGPGSDWIVAAGGNAAIFGGDGDDVIEGGAGVNWIEGGPGDDEIYAGLGADTVFGGTTAAGYEAFIKPFMERTRSAANSEPGRPVIQALHGGYRTRPTQDPERSACEPDVFVHPEVYPDSPYTISVQIFEDLDGDGVRDEGEGDANWNKPWTIDVEDLRDDPYQRVIVPGARSTGGTTVMPAGSGLPEGSYRVTVVTDDPAVWRIHGGAAAFTIDVTLDAAHPQITLPVGFYRQARVAGRVEREQPQGDPTPMAGVSVYLDANESGSYDAGERTDRTDAEGRYQFKGLEPGTQHVRVALDPGRLTAFPEVRNFRLQSGQLADNKNFVVSANVATVSGRVFRAQPNAQPAVAMAGVTVFLDVVGNGRVDPGEPTAITDASGRYAFPDLSFGSYTIQVDIDIDNVTSAPRTRAVNLFEAVDVVDQDFLIDSKGLSAFTALFAAIVENDPPVATPSADSSFAAQSFGDLPVIAFGDSFVQPSGGTIMGSVWRHDPEAQNGLTPDLIQGRGEPGIADQLISLFRLDGAFETLVATTRSSNLDASFQFTGLAAGTYVVRQTPTKKFQQVTGGGATKSETLYAVTNRAAAPANDRSTLWQVGTAPFAVGEVASFTEFVARDVAVVDHATAFIVGTATAGGSPGLWRYDIAADRLTSLGYDFPELGPLVALDVLDNSRLLGLTDKGMLVTYTPDVNLWQQVGRLQTGAAGTTQAVYPVGDLTVVSPREVSFVGMAGTLPDLTNMSFPIPAREQAIYRVDTTTVSAGLVLTAERAGDLQLPAPPKDELLEYLPGLDRTAAGRLFALGSLGGVYTAAGVGNGAAIAFNEIGRIFPLPDSLGADLATFGGLAIAPYELVPDSARTDFLITITDREVVTVGFGNRQLDERLIDGGDVIDAGCDASGDVVFGDDGFNLPAEFADFALPDDLYHEGGHDTIRGRGGDDTIDGGLAGDTIDGGDGADTIHGGREALNWIVGGLGDDEITGGDAMDVIYGNDGDDSIAGEAGNDLLFGGAGADLLDGGVDDDLLVAGAGGGTKGQKVFGGLGDDTIVVRDVTLGGEFAVAPTGVQADTYRGDGGTDTLVLDTSTLAAVDDVVFVSLSDAELTAYGVDVALGLEIARLTGGAGDNIFTAATFSGRAVLSGLAGKDELTGGSGDDQIAGGTGTNRLTGGLGNDTFTVVLDSVNTIVEAIAGGSDRVDASAVGTVALDVLVGSVADGVVVRSLSVVPAAGLDVSFASGGIETLVLGAGDDRLTIKDNASTAAAILAGPGTNRLYYDDIFGGWGAWAGAVNVDLVAGTATGTAGIEGFRDVYGGDGGDTLRGDAGDNVLVGGGGNDTILGGSGDDMLSAGAGLNSLAGNADDDTYYFSDLGQTDTVVELPGQGYDEIFVLSGVAGGTFDVGNSIVATVGGGRMTSIFAAGIDRVRGTALADRFRIADGTAFAGILDGGGMPGYEFADFDTLDYTGWTAPVTVDFTGQIDATVRGSATGTGGVVNLRHVVGGSRNDSLTAGGLPVWFEGGAGDDTLTGSGQNDLLAGGSGGDTLVGGYGDDRYAFADHYGADSVTEPIFAGGSDTMDFSAVTAALEVRLGSVTVTTPGEAGNSAVHAAHAIETVVGGAANDTFVMTGAGVTFPGTLDGGAGSNTLRYDDATVAIKAAVRAGGTPNVGTARNFTTVIAELNLFAPVFVGGFTGAVQENAPVTTVAFLARATDADDAPGNAITYSLKPALADDAALVTIDPVKGEVRLASPANYESKNAYRFTVIATDAGYPSRSTEQAVTVNVLNVVEPRTAPRIAAPTGFFLTEDTPDGLRFTGTPFSDADSPAATLMTVTLRVASGSIAAANGGGVVVGGTPAARTFTGTLASLNAYFTGEPARIVYTPALDASGIRLLGITIAEGPVSQRLSSTVNAPISIAAVNDAPKVKAPLSFLVTEDVASPLTWPAAIVPFSDVDSASLTVTLSVGAGSLTAASTAAVRVGGEPGARTFTGSSAALSAYFQQLGRVRYTSALDDTVQRTLTVTATDGQLTSATTAKINITPVNDRPTLAAAAVTLAGGVTGRPYEITYEQLKTATGPADVDSPAVSFVVEAVAAGTVQKWNGLRWVAVAPAGAIAQRRLDPGQKIQWIPPLGATGTRRAFTIRAYDGQASSTGTAIVSVTLG
jgi:Ca2+-binding RTX toxin-like protein